MTVLVVTGGLEGPGPALALVIGCWGGTGALVTTGAVTAVVAAIGAVVTTGVVTATVVTGGTVEVATVVPVGWDVAVSLVDRGGRPLRRGTGGSGSDCCPELAVC
jgi:hypothetical protein